MSERGQYRKFQITNEGFQYKKIDYKFSQVAHLSFAKVRTKQSMNFVSVGEADSATLRIELQTGKKISLAFDESGLFLGFNSNKQDDIQQLTKLYVFLSEKTFSFRVAGYINQIKKSGCFNFDGCKFDTRNKSVTFRNKVFIAHEDSFLKHYGYIELRKKNFGVIDKLIREFSVRKIPQFSIVKDRDVILYLLSEYLGLSWQT